MYYIESSRKTMRKLPLKNLQMKEMRNFLELSFMLQFSIVLLPSLFLLLVTDYWPFLYYLAYH